MTLNLTLPGSLYKKAMEVADREHISVEQVVYSALAEQLSALERLEERAGRSSEDRFRTALAKIRTSNLRSTIASDNWNRLMIVALQEYAARCRDLTFELQMASMAADPEVQSECQLIAREFSVADLDGLRRD